MSIFSLFESSKTPYIYFQDEFLLVCFKPNGYTVEKSEYYPSIEEFIAHELNPNQSENKIFVGIPHRIDVLTQGLILIAKKPFVLKQLNLLFEKKEIIKKYLCIVNKETNYINQTIAGYITEDKKNKRANFSLQKTKDAKTSILKLNTLKNEENFSLIEIELLTGRFHQIRATMEFLKHPIVNDEKYGGKRISEERMIYLLANQLIFKHPKTGETITIKKG